MTVQPTAKPTTASAPSPTGQEEPDWQELFGDLDWSSANLGELAETWRQELSSIEADNVRTLMEITSRSQAVLPGLIRAIDEVASVDDLLGEYCQRLRLMGAEIQQIEQLNRALNLQTANQAVLLQELDSLLERISLPDEVIRILEREPLDSTSSIPKVANAAVSIHKVLKGKFDDGLSGMTAVSERFTLYQNVLRNFVERLADFFASTFASHTEKYIEVANRQQRSKKAIVKMAGFDEIIPFLEAYAILISGLRVLDSRKHVSVIASYQGEMSRVFRKDFGDFIEYVRGSRLLLRKGDDKGLFTSLHHPQLDVASGGVRLMGSMGERLMSSVTSASSSVGIGSSAGMASLPVSQRDFTAIDPFSLKSFPSLEPSEQLSASQALHYLIVSLALLMEQQQSVAARIFYGLDEQCAEERLLKLVDAMMAEIFSALDELISSFCEHTIKIDHRHVTLRTVIDLPSLLPPPTYSASMELLMALDHRLPSLQDDLPVLAKILLSLKRRIIVSAEAFISDQVMAIDAMKFSARKRSGVLPFVSLFPSFIHRMEAALGGSSPGGTARDLLNKGYERITAAIFRNLDALALEAERSADEKERINASVMNIQNGHYLTSQLQDLRQQINAVESSLTMAKARYDRHLSLYSTLSLGRHLGRLIEFFEGMETLLLTKNTPAEEVAFHASYNKASARRVLGAYSLREIRKALEALHLRVIKHFDGQPTLQQTVWRAVQDEFVKASSRWAEYLRQVYPESGADVQLPYSIDDARACFSEVAGTQR